MIDRRILSMLHLFSSNETDFSQINIEGYLSDWAETGHVSLHVKAPLRSFYTGRLSVEQTFIGAVIPNHCPV